MANVQSTRNLGFTMGPDLLLAISTTSDKVSTEFSGSHVLRTVHMVVEWVRVYRPEVEGSIGNVRARVLRQKILQWQFEATCGCILSSVSHSSKTEQPNGQHGHGLFEVCQVRQGEEVRRERHLRMFVLGTPSQAYVVSYQAEI
jgi:hypothetical protein